MAGRERLVMYKRRGVGASGVAALRELIAKERLKEREKRRTDAFAARRGIVNDDPDAINRHEKDQKLKKQQDKMRAKQETLGKAPFVFRKINYDDSYLYKPFESGVFQVPKAVQTLSATRVLRSHAKKRKVLSVKDAVADFTSAMASSSSSSSSSSSKKSKIKVSEQKSKDDNSELCDRTFDAPQLVLQSKILPSITEEPKRECDSEGLDKGTTSGFDEMKTDVQKNYTFSINERCIQQPAENGTAGHFRSLYNQAVEELKCLCEEWTLQLQNEIPDLIRDEINVAIGYAKLLISQKLQQFADLISEHENMNVSTKLKVLSSDLDGFWNMVNNQVEDVYKKFRKLEILKQNNWQEFIEKSMPVKQQTQNIVKKSKVLKAKGNSGLRTFLVQARNQARIQKDENRDPSLGMFHVQNIEKPRTMSPVVMRVTSRAKLLGSPQIPCPETRSPPHNPLQAHEENIPSTHLTEDRTLCHVNRSENLESIIQTPRCTKKTPAQKLKLKNNLGSTPLRRSLRILQLENSSKEKSTTK